MTPEQKSALESAIAHFERNGFWEAAELRGILDDEARRTVSGQEATWSNIYDDLIRAGMDDIRARALAAKYAAPIPATDQEKP